MTTMTGIQEYQLFVTHTEGFQHYIIDEIEEKCSDFFSRQNILHQNAGIIAFTITAQLERVEECICRLYQLGSIDNVYALIDIIEPIPYDMEPMLRLCDSHVFQMTETVHTRWNKAFDLYQALYMEKLKEKQQKQTEEAQSDVENKDTQKIDEQPFVPRWWFNCIRFRTTAERFRKNSLHKYKSPEVSAEYGWALMEKFQWKVSLSQYDVNVYMHLKMDTMVVGVQLSPCEHELFSYKAGAIDRESYLHLSALCPIFRYAKLDYRQAFGRSSMKPTTAYNLLRVAKLQTMQNAVLLDPMAGCGTIPLEAAVRFPNHCSHGYILELDRNDIKKAEINVCALQQYTHEEISGDCYYKNRKTTFQNPVSIGCFHNDSRWLPLRDSCVDVVVCDMPFGNLCGSHGFNAKVYPKVVKELERVLRSGGTCVLLTTEKRLLAQQIKSRKNKWTIEETFDINMNNIIATVHKLTRN